MNRKNGAIGFFLAMLMLVMCGACPLPAAQAAERSWLQIHYDPDVPQQTRNHVETAADLIADMLTEYRLPLRQAITAAQSRDFDGLAADRVAAAVLARCKK